MATFGVLDLDHEAGSDAGLVARVRELSEQLERERARNAGLERGVSALSERVEHLRRENAELRSRLARA